MGWELSGRWIEVCSCKMCCPCNFGPAEPTQGWCSGSLVIEVERGNADGTDLSGARLALSMELPGDFMGGIDRARLYLDESLSEKQRSALEAIFLGKKGGVWEPMQAAIKEWVPSQVARIEVSTEERPSFKVGNVGQGTFERMKTEDGRQAKMIDAPLTGAFQISTQELAMATARWSDPALRQWESGGYAAVVPFSWKV